MYSLKQITWGSFLGGPLAGVWMISRNYLFFGMPSLYSQSKTIGFSLAALVLILVVYIPENIPGLPIAMVLVLLVRFVADRLQKNYIDERKTDNVPYLSNWRVAGVGLSFLILTTTLIITYIYLMAFIAPNLLPGWLFESA